MRTVCVVLTSLLIASAAHAGNLPEARLFPNAPSVRMARLLVLFSLLHAVQPIEGSIADLDRKNGFRDVRFGDSVESLHGLDRIDSDGPLQLYSRAADSKRIGGSELERIGYGFTGNRLSRIIIYAKAGAANASALLRAVERTYGPASRPDPDRGEYVWQGRRVRMSLLRDVAGARLVIDSRQNDAA